jgi:hypothetical protein
MKVKNTRDWFEFWLHFLCVALFSGSVLLLVIARQVAEFGLLQWAITAAGALLGGLVAGLFGDRFYSSVRWW